MRKLDKKAIWLIFGNSLLNSSRGLFYTVVLLIIMLFRTKGTTETITMNDATSVLKIIENFLLNNPDWIISVLILVVITKYIIAVLKYNNYKYRLTENGYEGVRGILQKRSVSIPYDKIQNVDIKRGVISRMLGLSTLQIQTAGYGAVGRFGRDSEGELPGLEVHEAERIREMIMQQVRKSSLNNNF